MSGLLLATIVLGSCGGRRGHGGDDDDDDDLGGGGSGLPRSEQVGDLAEADLETLCEWGTERQGGEGTVHQCEGDMSVSTQSASECADDMFETSCDVTVADVEDCIDAIAPDPCVLIEATPPVCMPMLQCAQPGA